MRLFWALLVQIWTKMNFPWETESVAGLHRAKNQKKLITHSWEKCRTDRQTDRQTDGKKDNDDFIGPSAGRSSNKSHQSSVHKVFQNVQSSHFEVHLGSCQTTMMELFFASRYTTQKMKFSIKDFFSKCDQIRRKLQIWSHLLKKSLMENFIFVRC